MLPTVLTDADIAELIGEAKDIPPGLCVPLRAMPEGIKVAGKDLKYNAVMGIVLSLKSDYPQLIQRFLCHSWLSSAWAIHYLQIASLQRAALSLEHFGKAEIL